MTELLRYAFARIEALHPEEQDRIARWLLEELDADRRWNSLFARLQDSPPGPVGEDSEDDYTGQARGA